MELAWSRTEGNMKWTGTKIAHVQAFWGEGIADIFGINKLKNLKTLIVEDVSRLIDLSVWTKLTKLESLCMCYSIKGLVDHSFLELLTNLKYLQLNNDVENFSVLENLTKLKYLNISGTNIIDVSVLANLTNLKFLDLSEARVVNRSALANLTNLVVRY